MPRCPWAGRGLQEASEGGQEIAPMPISPASIGEHVVVLEVRCGPLTVRGARDAASVHLDQSSRAPGLIVQRLSPNFLLVPFRCRRRPEAVATLAASLISCAPVQPAPDQARPDLRCRPLPRQRDPDPPVAPSAASLPGGCLPPRRAEVCL